MKTNNQPGAYSAIILLLLLFIQFNPLPVYAQNEGGVSIGDSLQTPDASAVLDLVSKSKGFLPPRMTTAERDSISNPATGLVVFDTDLGKLLFYEDGWKGIGLWQLYNNRVGTGTGSGQVIIASEEQMENYVNILDALSQRHMLSVGDSGSGAISTFCRLDAPLAGNSAPHIFGVELHDAGEFMINTVFNTFQSGENTGGVTVGAMSFIESNSDMVAGLGVDANYSGAGGDVEGDLPRVLGIFAESSIMADSIAAMSAGGAFSAISSQTGINIGIMTESFSPNTYANIGIMAYTNVPEENGGAIEMLEDSFPTRFTAAALLDNYESGSSDFNLFSASPAKSFFKGDVGIGTLSPQAKLDVAGAVNASGYLLNGDTITFGGGAWSQNGDNIYHTGSNVGIGTDAPGNALTVLGDLGVIAGMSSESDSTSFPRTYHKVDSAQYVIYRIDTFGTDTLKQLFVMAKGEGNSGFMAFTVDNNNYSFGIGMESNHDGIQLSAEETGGYSTELQIRPSSLSMESDSASLTVNAGGGIDVDMQAGDFEITSTTGAFFPPKMTATQAGALTPADGMMIYVTNTNGTFTTIGFWGYENGSWVDL